MELVGAGPADAVVDQAAARRRREAGAAELVVRFLIRKRIHVERRAGLIPVQTRHVQPVDVIPALLAAAVHRGARLNEGFGPADVHLVEHDARHHLGDGPHVDAVGQRLQHVVGNDGLLQRARRVEQRRFARHGHAFGQRADFELEVGARRLVGVHHLHDVGARHEAQELIRAAIIRDGGLIGAHSALRARERDGHARQHGARCIGHGPADCAEPLCEGRRRRNGERRQHEESVSDESCDHCCAPKNLR